MEQTIWIPSNRRIQERLTRDLSIALQASVIKEAAFERWLEDNAGKLAYLGRVAQVQIIEQVVQELGLEFTEELDYVKGEQ